MPDTRPLTFLCITTYEKGQEFMRECKRQGCRVILLTAEKLRDADWPRESLDDTFYLPEEIPLADIVQGGDASGAQRKRSTASSPSTSSTWKPPPLCASICAFPGMGLTTMRYFRDKLAMRMRALDRDVRVPDFVPVVNHADIRYYLDHVPGPWVLKPRQEASAIGIKKIQPPEELWPLLEQLGDKQSHYLLEKFLPGDVYHVDSVVSENEVVFANVSKYGKPPMNVAQGGGIFTTFTVPARQRGRLGVAGHQSRTDCRAGPAARSVARGIHPGPRRRALLFSGVCRARRRSLHQRDGRGRDWNQSVARVGAHRSRRRRWQLQLPPVREEYAGVILSLARQENPDTSAYNDPEVYLRIKKHHHAGWCCDRRIRSEFRRCSESYAAAFRARNFWRSSRRATSRQPDSHCSGCGRTYTREILPAVEYLC